MRKIIIIRSLCLGFFGVCNCVCQPWNMVIDCVATRRSATTTAFISRRRTDFSSFTLKLSLRQLTFWPLCLSRCSFPLCEYKKKSHFTVIRCHAQVLNTFLLCQLASRRWISVFINQTSHKMLLFAYFFAFVKWKCWFTLEL